MSLGVVVLLLATIGVLTTLDRQYGPLEPGSFGGILSQSTFASSDIPSYRLTASSGELIESMDNRGSHSITITSMNPGEYILADVQWSRYTFVPEGNLTGVDTPWQNFPATIPAHGTIRLKVTVHRPAVCPTGDGAAGSGVEIGPQFDGDFQVHWDSLLRSHTSWVQAGGEQDIELC